MLVLLLLAAAQSLLLTDARAWLNYTYRLEGAVAQPGAAVGAVYVGPDAEPVLAVALALVNRPSAPEARLLLNGYPVAYLNEPLVWIPVHPGDRLEVEAGPRPVRVRVVDVSPGLAWPRQGMEVEVREGRRLLAQVQAR